MDKRILWALAAAGGYVLLMSGGDLKNINALLKEHGIVAALVGGAIYFLANGKPAIPANQQEPVYDEFADLPPEQQAQVLAAMENNNLGGYHKQQHMPVAGFDARYKPLGV